MCKASLQEKKVIQYVGKISVPRISFLKFSTDLQRHHYREYGNDKNALTTISDKIIRICLILSTTE